MGKYLEKNALVSMSGAAFLSLGLACSGTKQGATSKSASANAESSKKAESTPPATEVAVEKTKKPAEKVVAEPSPEPAKSESNPSPKSETPAPKAPIEVKDEKPSPAPGKDQVIDPEAIKADYPKFYCENVVKLKLRIDVSEELAFFCPEGKPSADFRDFRQRLLDAEGGRTAIQIVKEVHDPEAETSEYILIWGYHVAIRPFEVKGRPLYEYIAKSYAQDGITMNGSTTRRSDEELDSGLHLWSADMAYDLSVAATSGLNLESARKTQYNLYQVQSGNEEMGFGVDALSEPDNPDYKRSVMLNLGFNDGEGFNDGKGGAIVLNLLHITLVNKGFPQTAATAINTIGQFLADSMFEGLSNQP